MEGCSLNNVFLAGLLQHYLGPSMYVFCHYLYQSEKTRCGLATRVSFLYLFIYICINCISLIRFLIRTFIIYLIRDYHIICDEHNDDLLKSMLCVVIYFPDSTTRPMAAIINRHCFNTSCWLGSDNVYNQGIYSSLQIPWYNQANRRRGLNAGLMLL